MWLQSGIGYVRATLRRLIPDCDGTVLIITAVTVPMIVFLLLGAGTLTMALAKRAELANIVETACNRGLKPSRTYVYDDASRQTMSSQTLAALAAERRLNLTSTSVTQGFLTGTVSATALIPAFQYLGGAGAPISVRATSTCQGVPPYPAKGSVILNSLFVRPSAQPLLAPYQSWAVFRPQDFGWDSGTGPGVEVQDWSKDNNGTLPPGAANSFVIELDSDSGGAGGPTNSSMTKRLELHRGTYEFSLWYFGRVEDTSTNRISVYLTGVRPVSPTVQKLTMNEPRSAGWLYKTFQITVDVYSIYDLTLAAEGTDDARGGNFNSLQLKYIKRPSDAYND